MGMFSNYNEHDYFIPNNTNCSFPIGQSYTKLSNDKACLPYCEYNSKGECIGYYWYYGESMNLDFDITGELTLLTMDKEQADSFRLIIICTIRQF